MSRTSTMAAAFVLMAATLAGADEQRIAPGTGTQDAIVIDTGTNGLCESSASRGDIQAAELGEGTPNLNEIRCGQTTPRDVARRIVEDDHGG